MNDIIELKPWLNEPDHVSGIDDFTGYAMLIRRGPLDGLCGYVGLLDHPAYGKGDSDDFFDTIRVHGGLTFSGRFANEGEYWWLGFDCSHSGDYVPGMAGYPMAGTIDVYRDMPYVKAECENLARQLYDLDGKTIIDVPYDTKFDTFPH